MIFLLTLLMFSSTKGHSFPRQTESPCSRNCTGKIHLTPPQMAEVNISSSSVQSTVYRAPNTVPGLILSIKYWRSYCPFCLACDPSELCTSIEEKVLPDPKLVADILKHKKCPSGSLCPPASSECLGGGLIHCSGPPVLDRWISSSKFKYKGMFKRSALGDACVQDWECSIQEVNYPIILNGDNLNGVWASSTSSEGMLFKVSTDSPTLFTGPTGSNYIVPPVQLSKSLAHSTKCLKHSPRVMCIVDSGIAETGSFIIKLDEEGYGKFQNLLVKAPITHHEGVYTKNVEAGSHANFEQLQLVMNELLYEQLQSQINDLNILSSLQSTSQLLHQAIISLSQSNPKLLPDLLKVEGTTIWTDPQTPHICPCLSPKPIGTFCRDGVFWENGVPRWQNTNDACLPSIASMDSEEQDVNLFPANVYDETLLPSISFRTSIQDQEARNPVHFVPSDDFQGPTGQHYWDFLYIMEMWESIKWKLVALGTVWSWLWFLSRFFTCLNSNGSRD